MIQPLQMIWPAADDLNAANDSAAVSAPEQDQQIRIYAEGCRIQ